MCSFYQKTQQTLAQFLSQQGGGQQQQQQQPPAGQLQPKHHQHQVPAGGRAPHALTWHAGGSGTSAAAPAGSGGSARADRDKVLQPQPPPDPAPLPGLALYYTEALQGVPHTLSKLVRNIQTSPTLCCILALVAVELGLALLSGADNQAACMCINCRQLCTQPCRRSTSS